MKKIREMIETKEPETPYLAARWEWNERYWSLISALRSWRIIAMASISVAVICSGGLVAVSLQQTTIPYFVEFNEHAEPVRVTRADNVPQPTTNQIRASLRSWVIGARSVYMDRRAQQDTLAVTYAMTDPDSSAYGALHAFHSEHNPYTISQENTTEVAVNSVMKLSEDSWRVEWTETQKDLAGKRTDQKTWQATVTVMIVLPSTEAQIFVNPVGVYVKSFSWAQRL